MYTSIRVACTHATRILFYFCFYHRKQ